jgi:acetyl esterase/lipase
VPSVNYLLHFVKLSLHAFIVSTSLTPLLAIRQDRRMDIAVVAPDLRPSTRRGFNIGSPMVRGLFRAVLRVLPMPAVAGVRVTRVREDGIRALVYRPDSAPTGPAVVWIHGGGFVIGSVRQDHRMCAEITSELGITVVSAEYRLAPENPYPAALDDVAAVWSWTLAHAAALGVDPERIVIAGESAGGGLAASLVQRLTDAPGIQPVAQLLFCPMLDDRTAADRSLDAVDHFVWNNTANLFGWQSYLGRDPGSDDVPPYAAAARRDDLAGLPRTWISVGDLDLFHDENVAYAERLRNAGVDVALEVVPGAPHAFENTAGTVPSVRAFKRRAWQWLASAVGLSARSTGA